MPMLICRLQRRIIINKVSTVRAPLVLLSASYTRRCAHTDTGASRPGTTASGSGLRIWTIFTTLALFGVSVTAYGIYDFYTSFAVWPQELREDLRPGIKAQHQGDLALSERYLRRAWQTCRTLPHESLGPEPWLKISGIACKLGEVLEAAHQPHKAYEVYSECLSAMQAAAVLAPAEHYRAVAVAMHLGELADHLGRAEAEEKWLSWSVEEFVRMSKQDVGGSRHLDALDAVELGLPDWTHKDDFEAALEALGSFYAKTGKTDYALNLYLQALSTMLPQSSAASTSGPTPQRRCRAAQMMTNISGLLIHDKPTPDRLAQANMWTTKGLEVAEKARKELASTRANDSECDRVWTVLLFNLGAVLEMQNDIERAKEYFTRALAQARAIGMREGIQEADDALARLSSVT